MAFIYWAESLTWESVQHHMVRQIAHMRGGTGTLIFNSTTTSPPEKVGRGPGNWLHKLEAPWKRLAMERHDYLAAQVLFIAGRRWQLLGMLFILQVCMYTGLSLQLEQDAKSVIVCLWLDSNCCLLADADTQCLNGVSVKWALAMVCSTHLVFQDWWYLEQSFRSYQHQMRWLVPSSTAGQSPF